ncbi:hypothetical protein FE784_24770 [Paenibacillus hemerocallicola]|uniref:Heparinase II/III-like C-terminal domain-containing protein n=1 Tax=Paenibacillus hemerocallicola TaxID=1172614 RepID=A0A5C4T3C5_9BACL|nr:heparinase II/III family protein [Paenibacillus hemerocallicola]TNJ63531.1 hypothetical protein FE784_24770 [Paenibacillus hemerocallicola]
MNPLKHDIGKRDNAVRIYTDKWTVMEKTAASANDGERVWTEAASIGGFATAYYNRSADRDTRARLAVDRDCLYIELASDPTTGPVPDAETVFVLLATPADDDAYYSIPVPVTAGPHPFVIDYNNWTGAEPRDRRQTFATLGEEAGVRTAVVKGEQGSWRAEAAIPLAALNGPDTRTGAEWRLAIIRYCGPDSEIPLTSWVPIRTGTVRMDDVRRPLDERVYRLTVYTANEGRLGAVFVGQPPGARLSSSAALLYTGFIEKTLVLQGDDMPESADPERLVVTWIDPWGCSTAISPTDSVRRGSEWSLHFVHPEPLLDGMYQIRLFVEGERADDNRFAIIRFDRFDLIAAGERSALPASFAPDEPKRRVSPAPPSEQVQLLERLVPDKVGFFAAGVPHRPLLGFRSANYTWSPEAPWSIVSVDEDGMAYPNDRYPESNKLTVLDRTGKPVDYPYYEDELGRRYFLSAHLWHHQRRHTVAETAKLAAGDPLGAARLLLRFATAYEGWVRFNDSVWVQHPIPGHAEPPYPYFGGMWDRWSLMDLHGLLPLIDAFLEVDRTNAFELLSGEAGEDVRARIVDRMLRPSLESVLTYPVLHHNVDFPNWIGLCRLGMALREPQYVHEAMERMTRFVQCSYLADGFWKEITLSYHKQTYGGLVGTIRSLDGWTDPAGYTSARDGRRYDRLDPGAAVPQLARMLELRDLLAYPNGKCFPVNDTWAFDKASAPRSTRSLIMPRAGIAKLTRGEGPEQAQLYFTFSPNNGHDHKDPLNIALYSDGAELLPDLGYTHTFYRQWSVSTLGHNTVTVNARDARITDSAKNGGNIGMFVMDGDVQVIRASQEAAYEEVNEYSRELWFVGFEGASAAEGYTIDLFRVSGGARHEYALNGEADGESAIVPNIGMSDYGPYLLEGQPEIIHPKQETDYGGTSDNQYYAYTFVKQVKTAPLQDGVYDMSLISSDGQTARAGLKVFGYAGTGNNRLFLGRAPSLRSTRLNGLDGDRNSEAVKYDMPKWIVRRESREGTELDSQFVHVMESYTAEGSPIIGRVEVLLSDETTKQAVVAVSYGNVTDIAMSSPRYDGGQPLRAGEWELEGKSGFIRIENGRVRRMMLTGGVRLAANGHTLHGGGPITGPILDVIGPDRTGEGHALLVDGDIPQAVVGRYVVITHPDLSTAAYPIVSATRLPSTGQTALGLDGDPGFAYTDFAASGPASNRPSRMTYYPGSEWSGSHLFRIDNVVTASFPRE